MVVELTHEYIAAGKDLVETLVREKVVITAAVWYYYKDQGNWRLMLELPKHSGFKSGYKLLRRILPKTTIAKSVLIMSDLEVAGHRNPRLEALRAGFSTGMTISGARLRNNIVDGELIEDAYVYRLIKNPTLHYVG